MQPNIETKEVLLKILYYGLPHSGKKSNLYGIAQKMEVKEEHSKEHIYSLEYFPPESFQIGGMKVKCLLYTFSCDITDQKLIHEYFDKLDGIVFVVDSQTEYERDNARALDVLEKTLKDNGYSIYEVPLVFQWNKQDLKDVKNIEECNAFFNDRGAPAFKAASQNKEGVLETLDAILRDAQLKLENQLRSPSKKLPRKKLGIGLTKREDKAEAPVVEEPTKGEEAGSPEKSKVKLSLSPKWKSKAEEKAAEPEESKETSAPLKLNIPSFKKAEKDEKEQEDKAKSSQPTTTKPKSSAAEEEEDILVASSKKEEAQKKEEALKQEKEVEHAKGTPELKLPEPKFASEQKPPEPKAVPELKLPEPKFSSEAKFPEPKAAPELKLPEPKAAPELKFPEPKAVPELKLPEPKAVPELKLPEPKAVPELKLPEPKLPPESKHVEEKKVPEEQDVPAEKIPQMPPHQQVPSKKLKSMKRNLPSKNRDEALRILEEGKALENLHLDILDLSNRTFDKPIHIVKCQIDKLLADGGEFKAPIIIESTTINDAFTLCGEVPSLFRETFQLKDVEISGNICLDKCIFAKEFAIMNSTITSWVKMQEVTFEQNFSLQNSTIKGISAQKSQFRGPCAISSCHFEGEGNIVSLEKASFYGSVLISSTNFERAHFIDTFFKEKVEFTTCIFEKTGNFGKIHCEKGLSLEGCVFNGTINLGDAYLKGESYFRRTEFGSDASFSKLLANGPISWEQIKFASLADFSGAHLEKAEFLQTVFHSEANFQEAVFYGNISLLECTFHNRGNFSRAVFLQRVDFRETQFAQYVSFANTIADYIILNRKQVEHKLMAEHDKDYVLAEQEYLTFKQIFEKQRQYEDRDWAHYRAKRAARKKIHTSLFHPWRTAGKILNWLFLDLGCGYGTKPGRVVVLAFTVVAIFALLYGGPFASTFRFSENPVAKWTEATWQSVITFIPGGVFLTSHSIADVIPNIIPNIIVPTSVESALQLAREVLPPLLMLCESLLGIFLIFLFIITYIRRLLQD